MVRACLVLAYDWGNEVEFDVLEIPLWRGYGETAAEASARLLEVFTAAELAIVLDRDRHAWLIHRETLRAVSVWNAPDA